MNIDSCIWLFSHDYKEFNYVLTSNGRKILFNSHGDIYKYRNNFMKSQGLNKLSQFDPTIHVKVWWFSRPNTKQNKIGQLEVEGKMLSSYEKEYKSYLKSKEHTFFYTFGKVFILFTLILFLWESLSQYTKYKQENN